MKLLWVLCICFLIVNLTGQESEDQEQSNPDAVSEENDLEKSFHSTFHPQQDKIMEVKRAYQAKSKPPVHLKIMEKAFLGEGEGRWKEDALWHIFQANIATDLIAMRKDFTPLGEMIGIMISVWKTDNEKLKTVYSKAKALKEDVKRLTKDASFNPSGTDGFHFDDLYTFDDIQERWEQLENWTKSKVSECQISADHWKIQGKKDFLTLLGIVSHTVQDFYAHSCWVKMLNEYPELCRDYAKFPLWEDIMDAEKVKTEEKLRLFLTRCKVSNETTTSHKEYWKSQYHGLQTGQWLRWQFGARSVSQIGDKIKRCQKDDTFRIKNGDKKPWKHWDDQSQIAVICGIRATQKWRDKMIALLSEEYRKDFCEYVGIVYKPNSQAIPSIERGLKGVPPIGADSISNHTIEIEDVLQSLEEFTQNSCQDPDWKLDLKAESSFRIEEKVVLHLDACNRRDNRTLEGYVFLFNVLENRTVTLIYPNSQEPNNEMKTREKSVPRDGGGWEIVLSPPEGAEHVVAYLVSEEIVSARSMLDLFRRQNVENMPSKKMEPKTLEFLLAKLPDSKDINDKGLGGRRVAAKWCKAILRYTSRK